jgi:hypothetical protein
MPHAALGRIVLEPEEGRLQERICVLWHAGSTVESAQKALAEMNAVPRLPASL